MPGAEISVPEPEPSILLILKSRRKRLRRKKSISYKCRRTLTSLYKRNKMNVERSGSEVSTPPTSDSRYYSPIDLAPLPYDLTSTDLDGFPPLAFGESKLKRIGAVSKFDPAPPSDSNAESDSSKSTVSELSDSDTELFPGSCLTVTGLQKLAEAAAHHSLSDRAQKSIA